MKVYACASNVCQSQQSYSRTCFTQVLNLKSEWTTTRPCCSVIVLLWKPQETLLDFDLLVSSYERQYIVFVFFRHSSLCFMHTLAFNLCSTLLRIFFFFFCISAFLQWTNVAVLWSRKRRSFVTAGRLCIPTRLQLLVHSYRLSLFLFLFSFFFLLFIKYFLTHGFVVYNANLTEGTYSIYAILLQHRVVCLQKCLKLRGHFHLCLTEVTLNLEQQQGSWASTTNCVRYLFIYFFL